MSFVAETSGNLPKYLRVDANGRLRMPAEGQTTIFKEKTAVNGTVTIHTVTAGKTFYLVGGSVAYHSVASNVFVSLKIDANGSAIDMCQQRANITATYKTVDSGSMPVCLAVPMPFPAATTFEAYSSNGDITADVSIFGWEE